MPAVGRLLVTVLLVEVALPEAEPVTVVLLLPVGVAELPEALLEGPRVITVGVDTVLAWLLVPMIHEVVTC